MSLAHMLTHIAVICLLLAGCTSTPVTGVPTITNSSPAPTEDQATAHPFATLRAEWTLMAQTPTRTPWPSDTPTITPTPYPTANLPDIPLSQEGPWLVFAASTEEGGPQYLWAINHDGTGLKQLIDQPVLAFDAQPVQSLESGVLIACVIQSEQDATDMALRTVALPGGAVETISTLIDKTKITGTLDLNTISASVRMGGLAWSADGHKLAFASALDGDSMDVYTYDVSDGAITHLDDGPEQAYWLTWSPDGRYVVHEGFDFIAMGGIYSSGMWSARADGGGAVPLIVGNEEFAEYAIHGWLSPTEMLVTHHCWGECEGNARRVNIETGSTQYIFKEPFGNVVYAAEHDAWLLSSWTSETGPLLILIRNGARIAIPGQSFDRISWSEPQDVFIGEKQPGENYTITLQGEIASVPAPATWMSEYPRHTYLSPDNTLQAWLFSEPYNLSGLWIGEPTGKTKPILADSDLIVRDVTWSPDSQRLLILAYQGLFMAERPDFKPFRVTEGLYINDAYGELSQWVPEFHKGED